MRRISTNGENETEENARQAWEKFSANKHNRHDIRRYEANIGQNLLQALNSIIDESFIPKDYVRKDIFQKKHRILAKAPVQDHVTETMAILPYEQQIYDYICWQAPAVRPHMGTHGLMRIIRNDLYRNTQQEMMYYFQMDIHHFFPRMNHEILKQKINNLFKEGKTRRLIHKVIDSYPNGAPLGIKMAQFFGMIYLADFDRMAMEVFRILQDTEKTSYWTSRYITEKCMTATDAGMLGDGSQFLAREFREYLNEGLRHYFRFVDNIVVFHRDKTFLRILRELFIMNLSRDYHCEINRDFCIRPTWTGLRLCGYVFYHERVEADKKHKKRLGRKIHDLQKKGYDEETIRRKTASSMGFIKHANSINLIKSFGMEKSLGKIIKKRRIKPPFAMMSPEQKVPFSSIVSKEQDENSGGEYGKSC